MLYHTPAKRSREAPLASATLPFTIFASLRMSIATYECRASIFVNMIIILYSLFVNIFWKNDIIFHIQGICFGKKRQKNDKKTTKKRQKSGSAKNKATFVLKNIISNILPVQKISRERTRVCSFLSA